MIQKRYLVALSALTAAIAGCSGSISDSGNPPQGSGATGAGATGGSSATGGTGTGGSSATGGSSTGGSTTGGTGGSGTGGSGTGGSGTGGSAVGGSAGIPNGGSTCVQGIPSSSQIPRMKNIEYDNVVRDLLGVTGIASSSNAKPSDLLVADSEGSLTDIAWNAYLSVADKIATEVMAGANKSKFIACDPAMAGCLTQTIRDFGRKAFRRPLTEAEVMSFGRLSSLTPMGTPNEQAEAVLFTFLASPSFIMLPELAQDMENGALKLNSWEVATRLSFFLWGSTPDPELSAAADAGMLTTKDQILAQAARMVLVRERTASTVSTFHRVYADIRLGSHWDGIEHDATKYPLYTAAMRPAMMAEIDKFFEEVAFNNGTFKDLFLSPVAFVNNATAAIYGLPAASYGTDLVKVTLDATQRPGFLTRVGFLSSFSAGASTSPILRGAYISKNILGIHIDDPPEDAAKTPVPPGDYKTNREVMQALTSGPTCVGCHAESINPAGFVMEYYDSIGGWQTTDPLGGPIVGTADVMFNGNQPVKTINTPIELMTELSNGPDAKRRYAEMWVTFATRRVPNPQDACTVDVIGTKLAEPNYTILNVLADLTQADSFRLRTVGM
jgi:hypothetical protein